MRERVEGGCGMARVGRDGRGDESGYALRANPTFLAGAKSEGFTN